MIGLLRDWIRFVYYFLLFSKSAFLAHVNPTLILINTDMPSLAKTAGKIVGGDMNNTRVYRKALTVNIDTQV